MSPPNVTFLVSSSSRGGEKRALHLQPRLVGAGLPAVRDDRRPVALPAEEEEDQEGGSGAAGEGGGGGIFQQVLRGRQVPLQNGGWMYEPPNPLVSRFHSSLAPICLSSIFYHTLDFQSKPCITPSNHSLTHYSE